MRRIYASRFAPHNLSRIIGDDRAAFFQIRDGADRCSNRSEPDDYGGSSGLHHGEFANSDNFLTRKMRRVLELRSKALRLMRLPYSRWYRAACSRSHGKVAHPPLFDMFSGNQGQTRVRRCADRGISVLERYWVLSKLMNE